jgi:hypothetical protein
MLIVVTAVVAAGAGWLLYRVWMAPPQHRDDLAGYGAFAVAVVVAAAGMLGWAWRMGTPAGEAARRPDLDALADLMAGAVSDQWVRAAADRGLLAPEPIAVRWATPSRPLAGPASAAVDSRQFPPLPGLAAAGERLLRAGQVGDLHALYGGLGSGRLVIAGPAGSGKSGAAVLLVLAALRYREELSAGERVLVPVPVIFTLHGWDPRSQTVGDWLAGRLAQTYPALAGRHGAALTRALLAAGRLAVILDGLDEMAEELRPAALASLSRQACFRLVLLTRGAEMAGAAACGLLEGAAAVELQDVPPAVAADYLTRVQLDPAPPEWQELAGYLRRDPDSALARALSSPLTLTLVRDTCRGAGEASGLLEFCGTAGEGATPGDIADYLLDRVLPAVYTPQPGEPPPPFDLPAAQAALAWIATRMSQDGTRDLLWWRIPGWAPAAPRRIVTGLLAALVIAPLTGVAVGLTGGPVTYALWFGGTAGLAAGLMAGPAGGPSWRAGAPYPRQEAPPQWRQLPRSPALMVGLTTGLAFGLSSGEGHGLVIGLGIGLAVGLPLGLALALTADTFKAAGGASSLSPRISWRSDRARARAAAVPGSLAFGIIAGILAATPAGFGPAGAVAGLAAGLAVAAGSWLAAALVLPLSWPASLAFAQLAASGPTPARLMRFLEDARDRNVLRAIGPVYQFRHARLQDRLAEPGPLQSGPPGIDDHVVGDAGVDGVMQPEADDAVIVRVERPGGVFAQHGAEGIDERLPEANPVAARPGRQRDVQPDRARIDGGRLRRKPIVEFLFPPSPFIGPSHPGRELRGGPGRVRQGRSHC